MAIEIGATCRASPEPLIIARVAGVVLRAMFRTRDTDVRWHGDDAPWTFTWGGAASALLTPLPPGRHEFASQWFVSAQPMAREDDLALVLAIVLVATSGLLYDGEIVDEQGMLGETAVTPAGLLDRTFANEPRDAKVVLAALRSP